MSDPAGHEDRTCRCAPQCTCALLQPARHTIHWIHREAKRFRGATAARCRGGERSRMRARMASWRKGHSAATDLPVLGSHVVVHARPSGAGLGVEIGRGEVEHLEQTAGDVSEKELAAGPRHSREMAGGVRRDPKRSARMSPRCPHPEPLLALPSSMERWVPTFPPLPPLSTFIISNRGCTGPLDFSPHRCAHTRLHSEWIRLSTGFCSPARCRGLMETAFFFRSSLSEAKSRSRLERLHRLVQ